MKTKSMLESGDVFRYYEPIINGTRSDDHIVIAIFGNTVLCMPVLSFLVQHIGHETYYSIRRINADDFVKWYPEYITNIKCLDKML